MNPAKQFWTLVKFQFLLNPIMWSLPLVIGISTLIPFYINKGHSTYYSSLSFYFFTGQSFFFVGTLGSMILAPDKFQFGRMKTNLGYFGTEFLLTRAIDRNIFYWSKAFLLYLLILTLPICTMIYFLGSPELVVREDSRVMTDQVVGHIPGSILLPESNRYMQPPISIPRGKVLIAEWQVWTFLVTTILLQILVVTLAPYKYGRAFFWILCYAGLFAPSAYLIFKSRRNTPALMEQVFFLFTQHQLAIWISTALAVMACQLFCERHFARQEQ